jgi:hypothetical protein
MRQLAMGLTSNALIVLAIVATVAAAVLLVVVWRRPSIARRGGVRAVLARSGTLLLCEALLLLSVGLVLNRQLDLYPTWESLLGETAANSGTSTITKGLTGWLGTKAADGARDGLLFPWRPNGEAAWHLATAPLAFVPAAYFQQTTANFPVVVVVAPSGATAAQGTWDGSDVARLVQKDRPVVVVFVRTDRPNATLLGTTLPAALDHDLRVSAHGWAIVGVGGAAPAAVAAAGRNANRYGITAAVTSGTAGVPAALTRAVRGLPVGTASNIVTGAGGSGANKVVGKVSTRLAAALDWAYPLLPPALDPAAMLSQPSLPPAPPPKRAPLPQRRAHPTPTATASRIAAVYPSGVRQPARLTTTVPFSDVLRDEDRWLPTRQA